ncbi:MAG: polyribonucleotide nucleotidyltransferase [bacterium]
MIKSLQVELAQRTFTISTGLMAKQANGAVTVQYGETVVLVTAVCEAKPREGTDFFPLTVNYLEKSYAAGRIPGGFYKREGRPSEKEVLTSRLIDRPLRPLFPDGFRNEVQIIAMVLSADLENDPDILSIIGASAALVVSDIPFTQPVAAVRIGLINNELVLNPSNKDLENSRLNVVVAGTRDAVVMVEGQASEISEETMKEAISFAHRSMLPLLDLQDELQRQVQKQKIEVPQKTIDEELVNQLRGAFQEKLKKAILIPGKMDRQKGINEVIDEAVAAFGQEDDLREKEIKAILESLEKEELRRLIIEEGIRADGRTLTQIRPIDCQVSVLPRTHGSALFTRGETQSLAIVTLGTTEDEQRMDELEGETSKAFMLHYNFPPFSVGEVGMLRSPGRREIGHGLLAERSLKAILPKPEDFPYTIRIVSDILESNGSSSMASVCGGTLALMDAGVPIKSPVAGIAMGLVKEGDRVAILSDIIGMEDHNGDMDFKVAGTREGITAFQMDVKIKGISEEIMEKALAQARAGRLYILDRMIEAISSPRENISTYAPRIFSIQVKSDKVGTVIGPGGKMIRSIIDQTGVKIDIEDDGKIIIASSDEASAKKAIQLIQNLVEEPEVGKIYQGKVKRIVDFGAFVEIIPGTDGLLHISQISQQRLRRVEDALKEGDEIEVKVIEIDKQGKVKLSHKALLEKSEEHREHGGYREHREHREHREREDRTYGNRR